jgi:hypothetical protein
MNPKTSTKTSKGNTTMKTRFTLFLLFALAFCGKTFAQPVSYLWSNGATTPEIVVNPSQTTTYYVTITQNGQQYYDSLVVQVDSAAGLFAQDTVRGCGPLLSLFAPEGQWQTLAWSSGESSNSIQVGASGWYFLDATDTSGCTIRDSVYVSLFQVDLGEDKVICAGQSVRLNASALGGASAGSLTLPANLQQGLVGYYPFNGNISDVSGNGNDASFAGATNPTEAEDRFGNVGSAYYFNGVPETLSSDGPHILLPVYPQATWNNFTISIWAKQAGLFTQCSNGWGPCSIANIISFGEFSNTVRIERTGNDIRFEVGGAAINFTDNQSFINVWKHFLITFNGSSLTAYIDGNQVGLIPASLDNAILGQFAGLGRSWWGSGSATETRYFGTVDDFGIWNRTLSAAEVQQLYSANTYTWSTGETTPSINVTPTQTTKYYCTVSNGNQSCTDSVTVTVNQPTTGSITANINEGESYSFNGQLLTLAGSYTDTLVNAAGCDSLLTLTLTVISTPLNCGIQASQSTVCAGQSATLTASANGGSGSATGLPANLQQGLVGYWPFNGNANDESGNGNHGTVNGATLASGFSGISNSAYYFDGSSFIEIASNPSFDLGNNYSICTWVKIDDYSMNGLPDPQRTMISRPRETGWAGGYALRAVDSELFSLRYTSAYFNPNGVFGRDTLPLNNWTHIAFTYNGSIASFYQNGVLVYSKPLNYSNIVSNQPLLFGKEFTEISNARWFKGMLDDIAIHNRALSAAEVQQLYSANTYAWSTGETTPSINVTPAQTTTYYCTVSNGSQSCTDSVTVTVKQPTSGSITASINQGESYSFNGQLLTLAGTYKDTLVNAAGCDSLLTLTLTVNTTPLNCGIQASQSTVCAGQSATLTASANGGSDSNTGLPTNLQQGLVGYWPFNGNALDESGNGNHGNIGGNLIPAEDRFGNYNNAYDFSQGAYINVPSSGSLHGGTFQGLSISSWINLNELECYAHLISLQDNSSTEFGITYNGCSILYNNWLNSNASELWKIYPGDTLTNNQWHHILSSSDFSTGKSELYVDGILVGSTISAISASQNPSISIGYNNKSGFIPDLNGKLDDIAIYNRALTASEVQQLYNANTYAWSTGETTPSINVTPTQTTKYYCTVSNGNQSCTDSVTVRVNQPTSGSITASINEGESYPFNGQLLTLAGTYIDTLLNAAGCDSLLTLTLTVNSTPLNCGIQASQSTLCAGQSATLTASASGAAGSATSLPANLQQGLVGYWPFNGNANDESGNGNNGTVNGATLTTDRFGNAGKAYSFSSNGEGNSVIIANSTSLNFVGDMSFSSWVKTGTIVSSATWLMKYQENMNGYSASLSTIFQSNATLARWDIGNGQTNQNGKQYTATLGLSIIDDKWHHVAGTFTGNYQKIFVDGVLIDSNFTNQSGTGINSSPLVFGKDSFFGNDRNFNGLIDDLAIYNRALSAAEVQQLYSANTYAWSTGETTPSINVTPTQTTTYYCTITNGNQTCTDSVTVTVNQPSTGSITASINEGESYSFNGQLLTMAGTYTDTLVNALGCDSLLTLTLTINTTPLNCGIQANQNTLCAGQSATLMASTNGGSGSATVLPANLQQGLVGYWPFNGNANDESGNGNNGTVNGATLTTDRFGNAGKAYSFDGVNNFMEVLHNSSLNLPNGTINLWFKTNLNNRMTLFYKSNYSNAANEAIASTIGYLFYPGGPTGIQFGAKYNSQCNPGQGWVGLENSLNFSDGDFHMLSCIIGPNKIKLYIDGNLSDSASTPSVQADICSPSNLSFARAWAGDPGFFKGVLDDITIYNRALSAAEVQQLYNANTYAWSTGETTPSIQVTPAQTTTYYCTVSNGNQSCTDSITINVNPTTNSSTTRSACGSYTWSANGQTYTDGGTYIFDNGCGKDSLILTITPYSTNNSTASACGSYVWMGQTLTQTGIYRDTLNCQVSVLDLTITPYNTNNSTASACGSYQWMGQTLTQTGIYRDTLNCQVSVLDLTITPYNTNNSTASACGTYVWNGQTLTQTGIYRDTVNCQISVLDLTITPYNTNNSTASACGSYVWNGQTLTQTGIYRDTMNCQISVLDLTITPYNTNNSTVSACGSYVWMGQTLTQTGIYRDTVNCQIEVLDLTITPYNTNNSTASACGTYQWMGQTLTQTGIYRDTMSCQIEVLNLSITPYSTTTSTASACGTYQWMGQTLTQTGIYRDTMNCQVSVLDLTITPYNTNTSTASACGTYQWMGQTLTQTGIYRDTVNCQISVLDLTITPYSTNNSTASACGSYQWMGQTLTQTGIYRDTVNCQINVLDLTITPFGTDSITVSACGTFNWKGKTLISSGYYSDTTSCGISILDLTITPYNTNSSTASACGTYQWMGQTLTQTGIYRDTMNCQIEVLDLTITPYSTNSSTASACGSYVWMGQTLTQTGIYRDTTNCQISVLDLTITPYNTNNSTATACGSFVWNGQTLTQTGIYRDTVNCQISVLDLTITPYNTTTSTASACGTYQWMGQTLTQTGIYRDTVNCQIEVLDLTITPYNTNSSTASACGSYVWMGQTLTQTGIYRDTVNCQIEVLDLTITPYSINNSTASACGSYVWNGQTLTQTGIYRDTMNCQVSVLDLTITPYNTNNSTASACGTYVWMGQTLTQTGIYRDTVNCQVSVLDLTITPYNTNNSTASACGSYVWNGQTLTQTGIYRDTVNCQIEVLDLTITPYSINNSTASACGSYVWNGQTLTQTGIYRDTTNCQISVLDLTITPYNTNNSTASACGSYVWNGQTLTQTGIYRDTVNCQISVLDLTITPYNTNNSTASACGSYVWMGQTLTQTGIYRDTVNCQIEVLDLTITPYSINNSTASACGSYVWNGQTLTQTGIYRDTVNCQIEVLDLTITPYNTNNSTASACGSYVWNGQTLTQTGIYRDTTNCQISVLDLTITPYNTNNSTASACGSYVWMGQTLTQTGIYRDTVNCQIEVLDLTITPFSTINSDTSVCGPYTFNGILYTNSGVYTDTIDCQIYVLQLTVGQPSADTLALAACDSLEWKRQWYFESDTITWTGINAVGCDSMVVAYLSIGKTVFENDTITACQTYTWNGVTYSISGDYIFIGITQGGCDSIVNLHLIIIPLPPTPIITAQGPTNFCSGDSVLLSAPAGFTYLWSNGSTNQSITVNSTGSYSVQTISGACTSAVSQATQVTINPAPEIGSIQILTSDTLQVNSIPGVTYQWYLNGGIITGANLSYYVFGGQPGSYNVMAMSNNCLDSASIVITSAQSLIDRTLSIYPNPGRDIFQVRTAGLEGSQLRVTDVLGREILRTKILMNETQVELSHMPSGTYFFRIEGNNFNKVVKVVKR